MRSVLDEQTTTQHKAMFANLHGFEIKSREPGGQSEGSGKVFRNNHELYTLVV